MDPSNWINLGIMLLTAVGVVVAARQANSAKGSASDAKQHEQAALETSRKMAKSNERAAIALEEANAIAGRSLPATPFSLMKVGKSTWLVANLGSAATYDVNITCPAAPGEFGFYDHSQPPFAVFAGGRDVKFIQESSMATPGGLQALIEWRDAPGATMRSVLLSL